MGPSVMVNPGNQDRSRRLLIWVIALSVVLRILAAVIMGDHVVDLPGTADQISYHTLALRVLGGHGFTFGQDWWPVTAAGAPTAHWSFLYTYYLAGVYAVFGPHPLAARILQAILVGILQPLLIYLLGRRLLGSLAGIIAAALTAIYAYFIYYSACLMTEPFYITAILGALYLAVLISLPGTISEHRKSAAYQKRKQAVCLGLCLGAAVLLRQLILLFVPFLFLWIGWVGRMQWRDTLLNLLLAGVMIGAMVLPFTAFNYSRFGRFVLLNTNSGYAFFWGNHPIYGTRFIPILPPQMGTYQDLIPADLRRLDEAALDKELLHRGLQFIVDDPGRYILLSLSRIPAYFMFWPSPDSGQISNLSRVLSFGLLWPFMLIGLIRSIIKPKLAGGLSSPVFMLIAFILIYTLIHLLSWALIRYRLPVDAILLIFAGRALAEVGRYLVSRVQPIYKRVGA